MEQNPDAIPEAANPPPAATSFHHLSDDLYLMEPCAPNCPGLDGVLYHPVATLVFHPTTGDALPRNRYHIIVENRMYVLLKEIEDASGKFYYGPVAEWPGAAVMALKDYLPDVVPNIVLSGNDSAALVENMENPPEVSPKMDEAFDRLKQAQTDDSVTDYGQGNPNFPDLGPPNSTTVPPMTQLEADEQAGLQPPPVYTNEAEMDPDTKARYESSTGGVAEPVDDIETMSDADLDAATAPTFAEPTADEEADNAASNEDELK